jgi:hypothetical protein
MTTEIYKFSKYVYNPMAVKFTKKPVPRLSKIYPNRDFFV